jgi:hypothetical protein
MAAELRAVKALSDAQALNLAEFLGLTSLVRLAGLISYGDSRRACHGDIGGKRRSGM